MSIIGLGQIGKVHIEAIQKNDNYELVSVCDRNTSFQRFIDEVEFFESYEKMLDVGGFEVVVVATPNNTHSVITKDILAKGYNVILEKPAANSFEELESLEKYALKTKKHIYYAFHAACASEVLWFKDYYEQNKKEFGNIQGFYCSYFDPYFKDGLFVDHFKGLSSPWLDSGVNALSVINCFLDLNKLNLSSSRVSTYKLQEISNTIKFDIEEQKFGIIETAWDQGKNFKYTELYFEKDNRKIILHHSTQQVIEDTSGIKKVLKEFEGERLYNHYINVFNDYKASLLANEFNSEQSLQIHKKLFEVGGQ